MSLIGAILEREPVSLSTLQPVTPPSLDRLVRRCLAKSPDDRWDTAHDVADELRWIAQAAGEGVLPAAGPASRRQRPLLVAGAVALAAAGVLVGGLAGRRWLVPAAPRPSLIRSLLDVGPAEELNTGGYGVSKPSQASWIPTRGGSRTALVWTPDGRFLVFAGRWNGVQRLYVRSLEGEEASVLEGTEAAQVFTVSPDGGWVVFWANGALRRVPLMGGPAVAVVDGVAWMPSGVACGEDGRLFYDAFASADQVIRSAQPERTPTALTKRLDGEVAHVLPHLLPGGRVLLYTVRRGVRPWGEEEVVAQVIATGERRRLLQDAADARYAPSGHLVFLRRGVLHAIRFDPERLEVHGLSVPVVDAVAQAMTATATADLTGAGQFALSSSGTLAYVHGAVVPYPDAQLVAVDRQGRVTPLEAPTRSYSSLSSVSPDGRHLAVSIDSLAEEAVWVYDLGRGTLGKLTLGGESWGPRWAPDGKHIAFFWMSQGVSSLAWQRTDDTAGPEVLVGGASWPSSWFPDGRQLALVKDDDKIWIARLENDKATVQPLTRTRDTEVWPEFSPDGRWLAYGSNASGRFEVYVQAYPGRGSGQLVSLGGGASPAWSPSGRELFFVSLDDSEGKRRMMAVDVVGGPTLTLGKPRRLFEFSRSDLHFACYPTRRFAVAPDGERFYVTRQAPTPVTPPVTHIGLVQNWTESLKARVPSGTGR